LPTATVAIVQLGRTRPGQQKPDLLGSILLVIAIVALLAAFYAVFAVGKHGRRRK
jgi:hypothetical protein